MLSPFVAGCLILDTKIRKNHKVHKFVDHKLVNLTFI